MGKTKTYWVEFTWHFELFENGEWIKEYDFEAKRFYCRKRDIKHEALEYAKEQLQDMEYRALYVTINDCYLTTDF